MWPVQLLGAELSGRQSSLIHLGLLIGSLCCLVLLTLFILRKLLASLRPHCSYSHLLSKQTKCAPTSQLLGRLSGRPPAPDLSPCYLHHQHHSPLLCPNSPADRQLPPPHHMFYAWTRQQNPLPANPTATKRARAAPERQLFVDLNGRHFVEPGGPPKAPDGDLSGDYSFGKLFVAEPPGETLYVEPSVCYSSTSHTANRPLEAGADRKSVVSAENYNHDPRADYQQPELAANDRKTSGLDFVVCNLNSSGEQHQAAQAASQGANRMMAVESTVQMESNSLNVPKSTGGHDLDEASLSRNASRSSSISSSNSAGSVQSTTAPMLSNAASSSFEKTSELADPSGLRQNPKLFEAQSQPNSPLLVQQLPSSATRRERFKSRASPRVVTRPERASSSRWADKSGHSQAPDGSHWPRDRREHGPRGSQSSQAAGERNEASCDKVDERHFYEEIGTG